MHKTQSKTSQIQLPRKKKYKALNRMGEKPIFFANPDWDLGDQQFQPTVINQVKKK